MEPIVKISIALCTCNGERYIAEQLDSIAKQSRLPDEIILCDDCSEDSTVEIVRRYQNALPIEVTINEQRLGTTLNFSKAIARCIGDVIFLCDQDDVWAVDKIENILETFSSRSRPGLVFSDAQLIGADSRLIGESLWKANRFSKVSQTLFNQDNALAHLLRSNIVTGATAAFRSDFKEMIVPIPEGWVHDYWIATLIAAVAPIHGLPRKLMQYRVHSAQQIGVERNPLSKIAYLIKRDIDWCAEQQKYTELKRRIEQYLAEPSVSPEYLKIVNEKLAHIDARKKITVNAEHRGKILAKELLRGNYSTYSFGFLDILSDIRRMLFSKRSGE